MMLACVKCANVRFALIANEARKRLTVWRIDPKKHEMLIQCCCNVGPSSETPAQHLTNIGSMHISFTLTIDGWDIDLHLGNWPFQIKWLRMIHGGESYCPFGSVSEITRHDDPGSVSPTSLKACSIRTDLITVHVHREWREMLYLPLI